VTTFPAWLTALSWISIGLAVACAGYVLVDIARRPQPMQIMNVVWLSAATRKCPEAVM
jgi:hypothetical protein